MNRNRYGKLAALLCAAALLLAGCGGGAGGEPTVTQTLHDELQMDFDTQAASLADVRAELAESEAEATRLAGELESSQLTVVRLRTELETANADVAGLTAELAAATANVDSMTTQLADASASVADLTAELAASQAEVANLEDALQTASDILANRTVTLSDARDEIDSLTQQLHTQQVEVARLTAQIGTADDPTSLRGLLAAERATVDRLTRQLETASQRVTALEAELVDAVTAQRTAEANLVDAEREIEDERQRAIQAQQAQQQAQAQAQAQVQGQEANQRAQNLKAAFPGGTATMEDLPAVAQSPSPVDMTVTSGRLTLKRGGYSNGTLSGNGLRSTTMPLTRGTDAGKMVVYTDRELSRSLLSHFGSARNETDMTRFDLEAPIALGSGDSIPHFSTTPPVTTPWRISHGISGSVAGESDDGDPPTYSLPGDAVANNTKMAASYTGYLYGVSGSFICDGGTNCRVQIVPAYASTAGTNNRFALETVAVTATGGGTLYFRPGSSPLRLYEGGPVGADAEYMVFGYWREDPTSAAGVYQFKVFAEAEAGAPTVTFPSAVTATSPLTYDGVAVGAYVEQDPNNPVDTHRQGEFTADVFLTASSESAVSGTIDDFVTTPTGGSAAPRTADRWVLTLADNNDVQLNLPGGGAATQGTWSHAFVPAHANASGSDLEPPAVTGIFDARIVDFVHILGAYGAEKR